MIAPAGWYFDPAHRHELRWFDGQSWTEHVATGGITLVDSAPVRTDPGRAAPRGATPVALAPTTSPVDALVGPGVLPAEGAADLTSAVHLLVEPGRAGKGGTVEHALTDALGTRLGSARAMERSRLARSLHALTARGATGHDRLVVVDVDGRPVVTARVRRGLTRAVAVTGADGSRLGLLVPHRTISAFEVEVQGPDGQRVGTLASATPAATDAWVSDASGAVLAALSASWQVRAEGHHPELGTLLVRRFAPSGAPAPSWPLALAALLAADPLLRHEAAGPAVAAEDRAEVARPLPPIHGGMPAGP